MPQAFNGNVAQVQLNATYLGEEVQNILWFSRETTPITNAHLTNLADAMESWWTVNMKPIQSSSYTLRNVTAIDWTSATSPVVVFTTGLPSNGTNVNLPVPGNVAACVTFRSAGRGRSSRGRNYVCGLTENVVTGNQFEASLQTALLVAYQEINTAVSPHGWRHDVYSQFSNGQVRAVGLRQAVTAYTMDLNVDSMRRRLAGRGR